MANITLKGSSQRPRFGGSPPYGNASVFSFSLKTGATGAVLDSDATAALAVGDKVTLGYLPEGFVPYDALLVVGTAFTASNTADLGFEYADGVDSAEVPQNAAAFFAAQAVSAATKVRSGVAWTPAPLPKEAKLIYTHKGAANAKAAAATLLLIGELTGPK
jgi:hypothetical protein